MTHPKADGEVVNLATDRATMGTDGKMPFVRVATDPVDVTVYYHHPSDGSTPYLVIDIDNESDEPEPMRIYRNDGLVYEEGITDR